MTMESAPDPTLNAVEQFLGASGMNPTTFGREAVNDPALVHELRRGRECRKATRERILAFIERAKASQSVAA